MADDETDGELSAVDVEQYTGGRLVANDETSRLLASALSAARRHCGWRVTPVATETVTVNGPGHHLLSLPTLNLVSLTSLTEDGVAVDVSTLRWSSLGFVHKARHAGHWSRDFGAITVTMSHGFDPSTAADFNAAVLAAVDRMSLTVGMGVGPSANLAEKRTLGVTYRWQEAEPVPLLDEALLSPYRLPIVA